MCGDTMKPLQYTLSAGFSIFIFLFMASTVQAQPVSFNHSELEWKSLESEDFVIHVHGGLEDLGLVAADIMDEVFAPVCELYDYKPDTKIHLMFYDTDDYSNGGAYYYNNKIIIWASSLDFDLRGQHNWLRNVLTHEFTHIIQLGASRKYSRSMPFMYLQAMDYEPEKRDDVVSGYPNVVASFPIPGTIMPAWFAEGTAQYMFEDHHYDFWDSNRDMLLRDRVLHGTLFDLAELAGFDKGTVGGESVYNQGFAFVRWLSERYGEDVLRKISKAMSRPLRVDIALAMEESTGVNGHELLKLWHRDLELHYADLMSAMQSAPVEGVRISDAAEESEESGGEDQHERLDAPRSLVPSGAHHCNAFNPMPLSPPDELGPTNNMYPRASKDGRYLYYLSNGKADWLGLTSLYRYDRRAKTVKKIVGGVRGAFDLTPDDKAVVFSRRTKADKWGRHLNDIYMYWFEEEVTRQLTQHMRLEQPAVSPDGKRLVCVQNGGGSRWLVTLDLDEMDGAAVKAVKKRKRKHLAKISPDTLTVSPYGTQFFQPTWHPSGDRITVARTLHHGRDLVNVDPLSGEQSPLIHTVVDERYPRWSQDGLHLYFSQDEQGVFNVYRFSTVTQQQERLTRVRGAAFTPEISGDTLWFALYEDRGFRLHEIAGVAALEDDLIYRADYADQVPSIDYDDLNPTPRDYASASNRFEKPFIIPRLMWDDGEIKPGLYLLNLDVYERVQLTAGLALARMNHVDMNASLTWAQSATTWYGEFYGMIRDHSERFDDPTVIIGEDGGEPIFDTYGVSYRFVLNEAMAGGRRRISDKLTLEAGLRISKYTARYKRAPASTVKYTYFKGMGLRFKGHYGTGKGHRVDHFINPRNLWSIDWHLEQHFDKLIREFEVTPSGLLGELFDSHNFLEASVQAERRWTPPIFSTWTYGLEGEVSYLSDDSVDDFFYTYAGGLQGMRGYSYYSLGGTKKLRATLDIGFPLVERTCLPFGPFTFKRAYASLFVGAGDAWGGGEAFDVKRELGLDLKLYVESWSYLPTALTLSAARGIDTFKVPELNPGEVYGNEWRFYLSVLFGFDQL
jgi:hypothetical protein